MVPDGQQVILMDGVSYYQQVFRLSSVAGWKTQPPAEVVAADRIGRWHPAVAALRSETRLSSIESPQRQRALRLLHALAREAEARGYTVNEAPKDSEETARADAISYGCIITKIGYAQIEVVACPHCQEFTVGRVLDGSFPAGGS